MTATQIESRLADGRRTRNWIPLLQARAALLEEADATIQAALHEARSLTDTEDLQAAELMERAAAIKQEAADMHAAFVKAAPGAHAISNQFLS